MNLLEKNSMLAVGVGVSALFFTATGFAQDDAEGDMGSEELVIEEVIITGTRIKDATLTAVSPVQVVDAGLMEDRGTVNLLEALEVLPVVGIAGASRDVSNTNITTVGSSVVNLRNMGANRTLVLVDGKRMVAGTPGTTQVDLSMIPTDFVSRTEILTGGASAIYGSDAIVGVVNLIYKRDFEGFIINAQGGASAEGDDEQYKLSLTGGHNFAGGRGNFMFNLAWSDQGLVSSSDRTRTDDDWYSLGNINRDPSTVFVQTISRSGVIPAGIVQAGGINYIVDDGNASIWGGTQEERFNRNEYRAIASPVERLTFAARATYDVGEMTTTFMEATYGNTESQTYFEPSPFVGTSPVIGIGIPLNLENWMLNPATGETQLVRNPFIPDVVYNSGVDSNGDGLRDAGFNMRLTQFGPGTRLAPVERETFRIVLGAEGEFGSDWGYETYYSYGRTDLAGRMDGLYHGPNLTSALTVGEDVFDLDADGDTTDAVCISADARARGCIPANMFGEGNMTEAMLAYVNGSSIQNSKQDMHVVAANFNGSLFELPSGPLLMATGFEYREESSEHIFDPLSNSNQNGYVQLTNTVGSLDVTEAYAELNLPILSSLTARGAARYSDYSTVGGVWAYDGGIEWSPTDSLRLRATYAHAVRAPNIGELFAAPSAGISAINDPCEGITASDTSELATNCKAEPGVNENIAANGGVFTLNQSDIQGVGTLSANNPAIAEETGDTIIFGAVWTPEFASGLALTVDWWDIEIEDAINRVGTSTVLDKCYEESLDEFCEFVARRATEATPYSAGSVEQVVRALVNSGGSWAEGIDLTARYGHDLWGGLANYSLSYTHLLEKGIIPLEGDPEDDSVGEIGDPENRWFATAAWDNGTWAAVLMGEFIGESYLDDTYWMGRYGADAGKENFKVDSVFYLDAQLKFRFADNYEIYLGLKNLLDEDPAPVIGGLPGGSADTGTNAGVYDAIGRRWYLGFRASF